MSELANASEVLKEMYQSALSAEALARVHPLEDRAFAAMIDFLDALVEEIEAAIISRPELEGTLAMFRGVRDSLTSEEAFSDVAELLKSEQARGS